MNREETMTKVYDLMREHSGRRLFITPGPNELSEFEGWVVGDRIVIVQMWKEGGCDHYIQAKGSRWDDFEADLGMLVTEQQLRVAGNYSNIEER